MATVVELLSREILAAGVPITGVSIGTMTDKTTWRIDFLPNASPEQRATGATVMAAFVLPTAQQLADEDANEQTQTKALKAVALALWECIPAPTMTKAQLAARVKAIYKTL